MSRECKHIRNLIADSVTGTLPPDQAKHLDEHLAGCTDCRRYAEALRREDVLLTQFVAGVGADTAHRQRQLLQTLLSRSLQPTDTLTGGRKIMTTSIAKLAIAASVAVIVAFFGVSQLRHPPADGGKGTGFSLLAKACAAEESLFTGTKIVHIQNEIIVYAGPADAAESLDFVWLPMCSVKPDGQLQVNQLKLAVAPESYVVTDHSWYDPVTGRFSRILKAGDALVFANSYDGQFVYGTTVTPGGALQVDKQAVTDAFRPPQSPAQYLGITVGLQTSLTQDSMYVQSVEPGTLHGGEPAHIYKAGMPNPDGQMNDSYWLFKVRDEDSTLAEEEFVLSGRPQLLIRRVLAESLEAPAVSWSLDEIQGAGATAAQQITVTPDMVLPRVSVEHMVERATFETYVFSTKPSWTGEIEITDCIDPVSAGGRMFILTARAQDGRHLVLVQSPTYNKLLGGFVKQGSVVYTSPNGFKVWGGGPQKWYSKILLQSARASIKDPPSENRSGYVLESPAGTFPALAVNGPVTDDELHRLVDSLVAAKDYLGDRATDAQEK